MTADKPGKSPVPPMVCLGVVSGARGLKGDVRIKSFTANPGDIGAYGPVCDETGERLFNLRVTGRAKDQVIARLKGIDDRDAALALKGLKLHVPRGALPEPESGEYYHADLVGLRADLVGGGTLGRVRAVHDFGGGASLEIGGGPLGTVMAPFTRAAVPEVDLAGGRLVIAPLPGLLPTPKVQGGGAAEDGNGNEE
ncbi:MAG TPA: ribosome maturation factor RimM [Rhodospirillales bacterium]|jgi:16S rRNA processing protein RimM|nr:ribosome maturation factor RimM [Rhodospirillales bacterium]